MFSHNYKYIAILILLIITLVALFLTRRIIVRFSILKAIEPNRRKIIITLSYGVYYILALLILLLIIGVSFEDFVIFASSILAVLGVTMFAQWSILSNLTASVILFFYHPVRIGSKIKILDEEIDVTGVVEDISGFYTKIKKEDGLKVTIPNIIILNRGIAFINP